MTEPVSVSKTDFQIGVRPATAHFIHMETPDVSDKPQFSKMVVTVGIGYGWSVQNPTLDGVSSDTCIILEFILVLYVCMCCVHLNSLPMVNFKLQESQNCTLEQDIREKQKI